MMERNGMPVEVGFLCTDSVSSCKRKFLLEHTSAVANIFRKRSCMFCMQQRRRNLQPRMQVVKDTTERKNALDLFRLLTGWLQRKNGETSEEESERAIMPIQKKNVLVIGATGRVGRLVTKQLSKKVKYGYRVYGFARNPSSVKEADLPKSIQLSFGNLKDIKSLEPLVELVDAVVWAAGARGPPGFGTGGPQEIDNMALTNFVEVFGEKLRRNCKEQPIFQFTGAEGENNQFSSLDDGFMGGLSRSTFRVLKDGYGIFSGELSSLNNGGFAQVRCSFPHPLNLSEYDGIRLRVKGDGRRYKVVLKDKKIESSAECVYQSEFDTSSSGKWEDIRLLFSSFIPVRRSNILYGEGKNLYKYQLDKSSIELFGFVVSKVDIGGMLNPNCQMGHFELAVKEISAFRLTSPSLVVLSSAAVTRLQWTERERQLYSNAFNIPIVQLNPGNILNEKLKGEDAVRHSGIPYCIIRATGLNDEHPSGMIVFQQGDTAVGKINRKDVADILVAALEYPEASFKTCEVFSVAGERKPWKECFESLKLDR